MDQQSLLGRVLDVLRAGGAEGDAYLEERGSLEIQVRDGELEQLSRAGVRGLAIRAMHEGRLGFVHTSAVDEEGVASAAEKALALARSANRRDDLMIPDPAGPGDGRDEGESLGIYDPSIEGRTIEEKQDWVRTAEAIARDSDPKVTRTEGCWYSEDLAGYWIANTKGLFRHFRRSHVEAGIQIVAEDQGEMQVGECEADVVRWQDLPDPGDLGRRTAERALRMLGGRPVKTGRFPVIFSPESGYALLIYLATALNGNHLSRQRSWLSERSGAAIGSPIVTIRDNARMPHGPATVPFDAEGVDTRDVALLEKGKVAGRLLDLASAHRLGSASTGSSRRRGYEQLPEIRASNLYLEAGKVNAGGEGTVGLGSFRMVDRPRPVEHTVLDGRLRSLDREWKACAACRARHDRRRARGDPERHRRCGGRSCLGRPDQNADLPHRRHVDIGSLSFEDACTTGATPSAEVAPAST
jgi:PmbA protein